MHLRRASFVPNATYATYADFTYVELQFNRIFSICFADPGGMSFPGVPLTNSVYVAKIMFWFYQQGVLLI